MTKNILYENLNNNINIRIPQLKLLFYSNLWNLIIN